MLVPVSSSLCVQVDCPTVCKDSEFKNLNKEYRRLYLERRNIIEDLFGLFQKIYRQIGENLRVDEKKSVIAQSNDKKLK